VYKNVNIHIYIYKHIYITHIIHHTCMSCI